MTGIYEDKVLSEIFACTLDSSRANNAANPPIVHLHSLAEVTLNLTRRTITRRNWLTLIMRGCQNPIFCTHLHVWD